MPKALDPDLKAIIEKHGLKASEAVWDCHGTWVMYHWAVEHAAAKAGITFGAPTVIEASSANKVATILVPATLGTKSEWSIGEAAPANNKNSYPFAMAEKRAKDRVALKLLGLAGLVYSEEEADDFKTSPRPPAASAPVNDGLPAAKNAPGVTVARKWVKEYLEELRNVENKEAFVQLLYGAKTRFIRTIQAYPGVYEGPDGSGLRGEAMKISNIVDARSDFDTFIREVELMARETQAQAAE